MHDYRGTTLGNYRLIRLLGEGRFTHIYLGEHVFLKRRVAVKVLQHQESEESQKNFLREAQIIARLEHPHIVRVLDFGVENGVAFLIMSYAPNGTLRQRHREGSRLPLPTIDSYLMQVASALQYAHTQKVIHRDVKPQNMLVGLNDDILLSDFGLAIIYQSTSSQSQYHEAGMVSYMAPEQFLGKVYPSSDQYALGVVVYEWLCGECPFQGTYKEIATQHQSAPLPSIREKLSTISPTLEQVVLKALAKDPKERFGDVQDFATTFHQACELPSPTVMIASSNQLQPSSPPDYKGRSRIRIGLLIGLVIFLAMGSIELFSPLLVNHHTNVSATATAQAPVIATMAAHAYATGTSKGVTFAFDTQHTNFNPYEKVLNPTNVSHLVPYWTTSIGNYLYSSPTVANGVVYVGSDDNKLYALDTFTGKILWSTPTGGNITSTPAVANNVVYVGSDDYKLYAFNASTGKILWSTPTSEAMSSSPVVANGFVYSGSSGSTLYAFVASTGKLLWSAPIGTISILSPAIANGIVYICSQGSDLYAFDAETGKLRWSTTNLPVSFAAVTSPAIANGVVYAASEDNKLYAFDGGTGKLRWSSTNVPASFAESALAVANNIVYVGSLHGQLYAFDGGTGRLRWSTTVGSSPPMVANGVVYISSSYNIYAFNASTGKQLWVAPTGNMIYSSPAVTDGVVYISCTDGKLYAFHLPKKLS